MLVPQPGRVRDPFVMFAREHRLAELMTVRPARPRANVAGEGRRAARGRPLRRCNHPQAALRSSSPGSWELSHGTAGDGPAHVMRKAALRLMDAQEARVSSRPRSGRPGKQACVEITVYAHLIAIAREI